MPCLLYTSYGESFDLSDLNTRCVDDTKVTDHHALIITGIIPNELSEAESAVYAPVSYTHLPHAYRVVLYSRTDGWVWNLQHGKQLLFSHYPTAVHRLSLIHI